MRYALIGCSRIASNRIKAAKDNGLEIVAVSDVYPEKMPEFLKRHGLSSDNIKRYVDYKAMLEEVTPDLVSIATGSGVHAKIALDCIEKGIHTIIEKPMAMSIADADAIITAARKKNVKVTVCHQNRFNPAVQKMRQALETGRFGKLSHGAVHVRWNRNKDYYSQASWRGTWSQDGGCLMNQCIHSIDILRWMMGSEIAIVYGQVRQQFHDYLETEDVGMAVVTFKNGAIATIEGTTNVYPHNLEETLYLFGETGTAKLGGKSMSCIEVWNFADKGDVPLDEDNLLIQSGHSNLFHDIIEAINRDREPYINAQAGKDALELVLAIYKSSAEGKPVELPLFECSTMDFSGLFGS